jgi:hypothetical protein
MQHSRIRLGSRHAVLVLLCMLDLPVFFCATTRLMWKTSSCALFANRNALKHPTLFALAQPGCLLLPLCSVCCAGVPAAAATPLLICLNRHSTALHCYLVACLQCVLHWSPSCSGHSQQQTCQQHSSSCSSCSSLLPPAHSSPAHSSSWQQT